MDHPAYHDRGDLVKTTITSEADQDLSTELSKDESAEPGPGSSAFQNAKQESLSRHNVNASSPGSAVESSSSFRSLPYAGSSLCATDPTSVDEVDGHLPSSAAGEKTFASARHVSLSPSANPLPHTEQVSSSALQSQGFSAESHLSQSPSDSQPPIMPEISLPPRSLTSEGFLQKHSEAIIRDTTATNGWNVGTIEATAAGGIATEGLAVASINAYTARQALHATRKNLEITKESAAAGTRSAKYAKKTFRFQRQSADKKSKNNSDRPSDPSDSSDSSHSSKSRGLSSSYKGKVRWRSDKQSASPTSIQRLKALPKTPSHDPSQRHIPELNHTTGIHNDGDRLPHDIVNQRNGDMLVTAVDEEEGQPTAPNDSHKARSIPRYVRNTQGGSGLSIKVELGVGEGRDEGQ